MELSIEDAVNRQARGRTKSKQRGQEMWTGDGWHERGREPTGARGLTHEMGDVHASAGQALPGFDRAFGSNPSDMLLELVSRLPGPRASSCAFAQEPAPALALAGPLKRAGRPPKP